MVTGHSLGGYLAEVVSTTFCISGLGWAAPGPGWHNGPFAKIGDALDFQNINFEHDVLGNGRAGAWTHFKWSIYIQDYTGPHHSSELLVKSMHQRQQWTNRKNVQYCTKGRLGWYSYEPPTENDQGASVMRGRDASCSHLLYCGRNLGTAAIPGSDGRCGPSNGPQCTSCKRLQVNQLAAPPPPCRGRSGPC